MNIYDIEHTCNASAFAEPNDFATFVCYSVVSRLLFIEVYTVRNQTWSDTIFPENKFPFIYGLVFEGLFLYVSFAF